MRPSATSAARSCMAGPMPPAYRRTCGAGPVASLKPEDRRALPSSSVRSPARAWRRIASVSRTVLTGFWNGTPCQRSMITCPPAPTPRCTGRSPPRWLHVDAIMASATGERL
jgi:hypothetical protein